MENRESIKKEAERELEYPPTLDIIKVDGRWAQIYRSGIAEISVNYLDNNEYGILNLNEFELVRKYDTHINMLDQFNEKISEVEIQNIYYDSETTKLPEDVQHIRKGLVHVFGEYKRWQ